MTKRDDDGQESSELIADLLPSRALVAEGDIAAWFSPVPDLSLGLSITTGRVLWTDLRAPEARVLAEGFRELRSLATDGRRVSWVSKAADGVQTLWVAIPESEEPAVELTASEVDLHGLAFASDWLYFVARCTDEPDVDQVVRVRF